MKRYFYLSSLLAIFLLCFSCSSISKVAQPSRPKIIFFDVNETLLDLNSMRTSVGVALGDREDLLDLWFTTMLQYSLVSTAINEYHDFGKIGVAALMMVASSNNIKLSEENAKKAIVVPLRSLPPHPDVKSGLVALKKEGYKLVTLTNSSNLGVNAQLKNAQLDSYFARSLSIEDIKIYKPNLKSYEWALKKMNVRPEEAMLVAAHAWDIAGAKAAGMQTAFIARPGKVLYPLAQKPDYIVKDLAELYQVLEK